MAITQPQVKATPKAKRDWSMPNYLAQARILAGGDWRAAFLLYRIFQVWDGTGNSKRGRLTRANREYVAMPKKHWAISAGLTESEIKNYALPMLREKCGHFLSFEYWKLRPDQPNKLLWVHVDEEKMDPIGELLHFWNLETQAPVHMIGNEKGPTEDASNVIPMKAPQ